MTSPLAGLLETTGIEGAAASSPAAMAEHVLAGGSPLDFTERPDWFSYSTLDTFARCPRQYALRYLCRLPAEQPRPAADFGSAAHWAFQAFTRERRDRVARGEPAPDRADLGRFFEAAWKGSSLVADPYAESWLARAEPMLDAFWASESARPAETMDEEVRFRLTLELEPESTVAVSGYIDRIDRLPSGAVELIDYKTGRSGSPAAAGSSLQLSIYALGCRDGLGLGRPGRVTLDFVEAGVRSSAEPTDEELDSVREGLAARAAEIRGSDYSPTPGDRACSWCDYRAMCPAAVPEAIT
jgi:putative RecB family exonuclease